MNLDLKDGIKFVNLAIRKNQEKQIHAEWISFYPHMQKPKSFNDYLSERLPPEIDEDVKMMSKDELMAMIIKGV